MIRVQILSVAAILSLAAASPIFADDDNEEMSTDTWHETAYDYFG